ncbi:MAG TPA: glycosyltransferase family 2 protein, partial [Candidatus Saccharimonadales bacterium]|nr:glycosyltransferase family 2 protein [Candidatus Saccharimonadales bacterium]
TMPEAILVRNPRNLGFCRANNDALKRSGGLFILCLNADAVLEPDYLEKALPAFESDPAVGMVAGKIRRFEGDVLDSAGQFLTRARRIRDRGYGEEDRGLYDEPGEVFSVCGAVALYRRAMVDAVSRDGEFFDEDFFSFGEDLDVCWRARRAGWRAVYVPAAGARHFRGGSQAGAVPLLGRISQMARRPPEVRAHIVKNRYLMIVKNDTAGAFLRDLPFILAWEAVQWSWLLLASPSAIPHLWRMRGTLAEAWRRRRSGAVPGGA